MPKAAFLTLGCKVNQFETETMEGLFLQRGYELVPFAEKADVYVINTCSVTSLSDKKSRQMIRRAQRQNPKAILAAVGCYAQAAPDEVGALEGIRVVLGTRDRSKIVDLVEQAMNEDGVLNSVSDIMKLPLKDGVKENEQVLVVDEMFTIDDEHISSNMILALEKESLETLFSRLGVQV